MPYTEEFKKLRRHFSYQYSDKAKAETFAFEKAFKVGIKTFQDKRNRRKNESFGFDLEE